MSVSGEYQGEKFSVVGNEARALRYLGTAGLFGRNDSLLDEECENDDDYYWYDDYQDDY